MLMKRKAATKSNIFDVISISFLLHRGISSIVFYFPVTCPKKLNY